MSIVDDFEQLALGLKQIEAAKRINDPASYVDGDAPEEPWITVPSEWAAATKAWERLGGFDEIEVIAAERAIEAARAERRYILRGPAVRLVNGES